MRRPLPGVGREFLPLVAAVAVACWLACLGCSGEPAVPVGVGSPAPAFTLPRLEGGELASATLIGRPVILNFWATWCQPCRKEFPVLNALDRDSRVEVVTIALDEDGQRIVAPFVRREGLEYTVLLGNQEVFERFNGFTIPYTLVLDPAQTVVGTYRGPASAEDLRRDLAPFLGAAGEESAATP